MAARLLIGTSGWAYSSWKPDFYPQKLAAAKFLSYYASQLTSVEVNLTFRQLLKETTAAKWLNETPPEFAFAIKAHQVITHIKRLKNTEEFLARFLSTLTGLAEQGKLGPVLFQLPPNLQADPGLLVAFMAMLPKGLAAAFEFRHASWFADDIFSALAEHNRALCVAESEERITPDVITAGFCYYRYRKPQYTPTERQAMVQRIQEHLSSGRDVFAYFKHEETPQGALYARELLREIRTVSV
jgi:uncharacterized protein YecE (DUF72 family)